MRIGTAANLGLLSVLICCGSLAAISAAVHAETQLKAPVGRGLSSSQIFSTSPTTPQHSHHTRRRLTFISQTAGPAATAGFSISIEAGSSPNPAPVGLLSRSSSSSSSDSGVDVGIRTGAGGPPLGGPALHLDINAQPQAADSARGSSSDSPNSSTPSDNLQSDSREVDKVDWLTGSGANGNSTAASGPSNVTSNRSSSSGSTAADTAVAAAALLPLSISSRHRAVESPLIPAVDYYYKSVNGSEDMPLGLPVTATPGLALTRWVLSAWSISNLSAPAGLVDSTMQRVEQLINNFTRMSPGQVQLSATANVTVPYVFRGVSEWTPAAIAAMKQAASDAVGGYDPAYIMVLLEPPDFGVKTADFLDSSPAPVTTVSSTRQVVFYQVNSSNKRRHHRKLLQQAGVTAAAATPAVGTNSSTGMPWGADGPVRHGRTSNKSEWTHVWVSYHRLDPLNVTVLLQSLSTACNNIDLLRGADVTATPCGQHTQQLLQQAGVQVDTGSYVEYLKHKPMVSVSVRLAVGVTQQQADSNTDMLVAMWLAQPRNIAGAINMSGLPDPISPNALIKWIVTPEVWGAQVPPSPAVPGNPAGLRPGTIAGITIGSVAFAAVVAGMVVLLIHRRSKHIQLMAKSDTASDTSSRRRRRRRPAKPRYLLPDLPPAADDPITTTASPTIQEAVADHAGASADDEEMSPDQIRPAMKELGDSVTSAARFELEDGDADIGHGVGDSTSGVVGAAEDGSRRVLAARQALLAEQHVTSVAASSSDTHLVNSARTWQPAGTPNAVAHVSWTAQDNTLRSPSLEAYVPPHDGFPATTVPGLVGAVHDEAMHQQAPSTPPRSWPMHASPQQEDNKNGSSVQGAAPVSMKVSKSPFVRSYDFSQLASELPSMDMISSALDPCITSSSRPTSTNSTHELHGIGSTQISVAANGNFTVVNGVDG